MGENGEGNEKRLEQGRLVNLSGKEKERFAGGDGLGRERDERRVGNVESNKEGGWIGRVFLDRSYCGGS
jgi:hypothetical protein